MKDISKYIADGIKKDGHPLDLFIRKVINPILSEFCVPWLVDCLKKYSEEDFHKRMSDNMFDFISDWENNHPKKFKAFLIGARRLRYAYDFNSEEITKRVVTILQDNGWIIHENEYVKLYFTMEALRERIER
jgi:hypothetical protein